MINANLDKKVALTVNGKRLTDYVFDSGDIYEKIALMKKGKTVYVYDLVSECFKFKLEYVTDVKYCNNTLIVTTTTGGTMGVYDLYSRCIIPPIYKNIYNKGSYYVATSLTGKITLFKVNEGYRKPDVIIPEKKGFTDIRLLDNGIITYVKKGDVNLCGVYSYAGFETVPTKYKEIHLNKDHIRVTSHDGFIGIYYYSGNEILPAAYDIIRRYGSCYVVGVNEEKFSFGLYSSNGKQLLAPKYNIYKISSPIIVFCKGEEECAFNYISMKRILADEYKAINIYFNVVLANKKGQGVTLHSIKDGKKLLDDVFDSYEYMAPFLIKLFKEGKLFYYLTQNNQLLDATKYSVKYEIIEGKIYIKDKGNNTEWIPFE